MLYKSCISQNIAVSVGKHLQISTANTVDHLTTNTFLEEHRQAIYISLLVFSILKNLFLIVKKSIIVVLAVLFG